MENSLPPQNSTPQNGNYPVPKENLLVDNPFVKNRILIAGLVVFLIFFFAVEIYILFRYMSEAREIAENIETSSSTVLTPIPTHQPDQPLATASGEMKGWKTYTNTEYGFEFMYPPSWIYKDYADDNGGISGRSFDFYSATVTPDPSYGDHIGNEVFVLAIFDKDEVNLDTRLINSTVDGHQAARGKNYIKIFGENYTVHLGFKDEAQEYFPQILSTFKFIE